MSNAPCDVCGLDSDNHDGASGINLCSDCDNGIAPKNFPTRRISDSEDGKCPLCGKTTTVLVLFGTRWMCMACSKVEIEKSLASTSNPIHHADPRPGGDSVDGVVGG